MVEAEKALRAADQRQAELDDVECRLRREFEEQERQLRRDRGELTALEKRLRAAQAELDIERMRQRERELDEWQATLTQLHTDLEEQWRDLQRRNAELHQQEVVLRKGWQDLPPRRAEQGGLNRSGHRATWEASSHLSG
jgi:DNA repair exonuclease SbcCD ATPase subunit